MILAEHAEAVRAGWIARSTEPIWQRASGFYGCDRTRTTGEKWQLSRSPWSRQILDDLRNPEVREVVEMASAQSAKSAPALIWLAWSIAHDPGPTLWLTGDNDLAKDASQERIQPTLDRCPDLDGLLLDNRLDKTTWKIRTKPCTIDIAGAQSATSLEQNPYRRIVADECRQFPDGFLQKLEKRQRSYADAKRLLCSCPALKGDEFHERYLAGTQCEWVFPCMGCGHELKLEWRLMRYEDGKSEFGKSEQNAPALLCGGCGHRHLDQPATRRHILEKGSWQAQNPTPQAGVVSYHWNALLPPWIRWADLVLEWKRANELKHNGNIEPLKIFVCETLGEPWEERVEQADYANLMSRAEGTGYFCPEVEGRRNVWLCKERWPLGKRSLLMVDVQQDVKYFDIRGWGLGGISRLLGYGKAFTFEDIRDIQQEMKILDGDVGVDEGYLPAEVRQACLKYHWKAFKGVDQDYFAHDGPDGKKIRRQWAVSRSDPYIGTGQAGRYWVPLVLFSVGGINEMLELFLAGKGPVYEIPVDCHEDYFRQLAAVKPMLDKNGKKIWKQIARDDHYRDCSKESLVGAICLGLVGSAAPGSLP